MQQTDTCILFPDSPSVKQRRGVLVARTTGERRDENGEDLRLFNEQVRKRAPFWRHFYTKNDQFTKTGSGHPFPMGGKAEGEGVFSQNHDCQGGQAGREGQYGAYQP